MGEMLHQVKERRNQKWENCQNFPEPPQVSPAASSAGLKLYALAFYVYWVASICLLLIIFMFSWAYNTQSNLFKKNFYVE